MRKGTFITFEGIDGVGKTTQISILARELEKRGYEVLVTREPGGTPVAERVRSLVLDGELPLSQLGQVFLFMASRSEHVSQIIRPALAAGRIVLCDRFCDSTYAYQGMNLDLKILRQLNSIATGGLDPDVTLLLDGDPALLANRRLQRGVYDRYENQGLEFQQGLRQRYLALKEQEPERIKLIDALASQQEVGMAIRRCLKIF